MATVKNNLCFMLLAFLAIGNFPTYGHGHGHGHGHRHGHGHGHGHEYWPGHGHGFGHGQFPPPPVFPGLLPPLINVHGPPIINPAPATPPPFNIWQLFSTTTAQVTTTTRPPTTTTTPVTTTTTPVTTTTTPVTTITTPVTTAKPPPKTTRRTDNINWKGQQQSIQQQAFIPTTPSKGNTPARTPPPSPPPLVQPCRKSGKADIVLLMDASSSIGSNNWLNQVKFADEITQAFNVGPNDVRFAAMIFNSEPVKIFNLNTYFDHASISKALLDIPYPYLRGTYTHLALKGITHKQMFSSARGGRDNAKDIIIVMTDGQSSQPSETLREAQNLKDLGVTLISVGIGSAVSLPELEGIASKPQYVVQSRNYSLLDYIKRDLVKVTCESV